MTSLTTSAQHVMSRTRQRKAVNMALDNVYSIRMWDSFYNTYVMIPITNINFTEALERGEKIAYEYGCDEYDSDLEVQVWVDCGMGTNTMQMVGYFTPDENGDIEYIEMF